MNIKNIIVIQDWAGNELFKGHYQDRKIDDILKLNSCNSCNSTYCSVCDDTGYSGDFEVYWLDESDERNVYEFINY